MEDAVLEFLGKIVAYGGGAAVIAYGIFRFLGEKWLENKFAQQLENLRHEKAKELEDIRYRINAQFSRVTKIHEKEFEVLPQAWSKLIEALAHVSVAVSPMQSYPDLDAMSAPAMDSFLSKCELEDHEKAELKASHDKLKYYSDKMFWYRLRDVKNRCRDFHTFIQKNSIFLSEDLRENFRKIDDLMWECIVDREVGHEAKDHKMWMAANKRVKEEAEPLRKNIESLVQERLKYERAE